MSNADSPAPSETENKRGEVVFRFCPEWYVGAHTTSNEYIADLSNSSNMLYPKEDRATSELLYVCRACHAVQKFDTNCTERKHLGSTIGDTAGVTTDVANDPTVGDDSSALPCFCTMCGDALRCIKCDEPIADDSDLTAYAIAQEEDVDDSSGF